ncbi:MAG TPA: hypothetical protein VLG11_03880 [Candidatus Saccharimonadales bacterium]|nr:hypothetical protein [Candidatus Saccharimonadales bacterium]
MERSPFKLMQALSGQLNAVFSPIDVHSLPAAAQKVVLPIRQQVIDARLDIRDYEYAQTRAEQLNMAHEAKTRLEGLNKNILAASQHGIFGPADVAQISATIQQIISLLA